MLENEISRRTLIKVIAAGCGVVVASSLPREWVKPVIDAGMLPVHAQTTSGGTISGRVYFDPLFDSDNPFTPVDPSALIGISGKRISVDGTALFANNDSEGYYSIANVPAGNRDIQCTPLATFPFSPWLSNPVSVTVPAGGTVTQNFPYTAT